MILNSLEVHLLFGHILRADDFIKLLNFHTWPFFKNIFFYIFVLLSPYHCISGTKLLERVSARNQKIIILVLCASRKIYVIIY